MAWTADDLITSARRRGAIPTSQSTFTDADILAIADEEIVSYIIPLVLRTREEFYLQTDEFPLVSGTEVYYRIPTRALAGATRDVVLVDNAGVRMDLPRIMLDDLELASWGYYVQGDLLCVVNRTTFATATKMRISYYLRPNRLVLTAAAGPITAYDAVAKTVTATCSGLSGTTKFDVIKGTPIFSHVGWDMAGTYNAGTTTMSAGLPSGIAVGDYLCKAGETPIPQVPPEFHPLLAQRVAVKFLEAQGDAEQLAPAAQVLQRMEIDATSLISPRMQGEPRKIIPRSGLWRRWTRRS